MESVVVDVEWGALPLTQLVVKDQIKQVMV